MAPRTLDEYCTAIGPARELDREIANTMIPGSVEILAQYRDGLLTESECVTALLDAQIR